MKSLLKAIELTTGNRSIRLNCDDLTDNVFNICEKIALSDINIDFVLMKNKDTNIDYVYEYYTNELAAKRKTPQQLGFDKYSADLLLKQVAQKCSKATMKRALSKNKYIEQVAKLYRYFVDSDSTHQIRVRRIIETSLIIESADQEIQARLDAYIINKRANKDYELIGRDKKYIVSDFENVNMIILDKANDKSTYYITIESGKA